MYDYGVALRLRLTFTMHRFETAFWDERFAVPRIG